MQDKAHETKPKRAYERPELIEVQLLAEDVMLTPCKLMVGGANPNCSTVSGCLEPVTS